MERNTHTHTHKRNHKVNSQNLQVTQGSEGSIFNAADLVVVQLPAGRKGKYEGLLGNQAALEHRVPRLSCH